MSMKMKYFLHVEYMMNKCRTHTLISVNSRKEEKKDVGPVYFYFILINMKPFITIFRFLFVFYVFGVIYFDSI